MSFQLVPGSGWGGPVPGLPPHPLYSDPHIFTHPYQPNTFNHSCLHIPPPPTSIDNFSDTVPSNAIYDYHLSDTSTQHHSLYVSYPFHANMHYTHGSHDIGSTGSDGSVRPIITDSVLPYYNRNIAPFSPPHFAQDHGGPGDHPAAMFAGSQDQEQHRRDFEAGRIDYTGQDRFSHIQQHLDSVRGAK